MEAAGTSADGPLVAVFAVAGFAGLVVALRRRVPEVLMLAGPLALIVLAECVWGLYRPASVVSGLGGDFPFDRDGVAREWGLWLATAGASVLVVAMAVALWQMRRDWGPRERGGSGHG